MGNDAKQPDSSKIKYILAPDFDWAEQATKGSVIASLALWMQFQPASDREKLRIWLLGQVNDLDTGVQKPESVTLYSSRVIVSKVLKPPEYKKD